MPSGLYGNWGAINVFLHNLQRAKTKEKPLMNIGEVIVGQLRKNIEQQLLDFTPLSEAYAKRKLDPRILIETGQYVDNIIIKDIQSDGTNFSITIGMNDGTTEDGLKLSELADYLEYGTDTMPGRYPFYMTWQAMKDKVKNDLIREIAVNLEEGDRWQ